MSYLATTISKKKLYATIISPDGKRRNLGRVDNKLWAPRAWFYRFVTFPILKLKYKKES